MNERTGTDPRLVTNSKAVITLTLGILSILVPFLGLILGIIGIVVYYKAKNEIALTGEGGQGYAVSGLICSIVGLTLQIIMLLGIIAFNSLMML
ncbi:DUF4190 domain-containing protein [Planococcus sp. X10-3]|uniref:DUF4190 domain-containing protein n=1 Tax=Planococcus sp. X10-3 TaxID=3061240 RepID=UPI003BB08562